MSTASAQLILSPVATTTAWMAALQNDRRASEFLRPTQTVLHKLHREDGQYHPQKARHHRCVNPPSMRPSAVAALNST
ncbi:MAG: hypothetical protein U5N55_02440 [Cypionkella sp.]|nr:hypothetical protein [Cypionkella sp.]